MNVFWFVIRLDVTSRNGPTMRHASFESARREAERLCEVVGGAFGVFEFKGIAEPPKRTVWRDAEDADLEVPF